MTAASAAASFAPRALVSSSQQQLCQRPRGLGFSPSPAELSEFLKSLVDRFRFRLDVNRLGVCGVRHYVYLVSKKCLIKELLRNADRLFRSCWRHLKPSESRPGAAEKLTCFAVISAVLATMSSRPHHRARFPMRVDSSLVMI